MILLRMKKALLLKLTLKIVLTRISTDKKSSNALYISPPLNKFLVLRIRFCKEISTADI